MIRASFITLLLLAQPAIAGDRLPLFDGHIHYSVGSPEAYPPDRVIQILDEAGIYRALLSSTPNDGTVLLHSKYPQRFVPELRPYRKTRDLQSWREERREWFKDPGTVEFIQTELQRGIYRGIGEFHLDGNEADSPEIKRIVELATQHKLWLHAHSDALAVEKLFELGPELRIIWAHAGMNESPATVGRMLSRYPGLTAELSYRNVVSADGQLVPEWRALFVEFPDRFIYGSDTWVPSRWADVIPMADSARRWLSQLPPEIADNIAYRNAEKLFGK